MKQDDLARGIEAILFALGLFAFRKAARLNRE